MPISAVPRRALSSVVALSVLIGLAGCSDDETASPDGLAKGFPAHSSPLPATDAAKAERVSLDVCEVREGGGMRAQGTIDNSGQEEGSYSIVVYFVSKDDEATAYNWAAANLTVPAGMSIQYVAERSFTVPAGTTLDCRIESVS